MNIGVPVRIIENEPAQAPMPNTPAPPERVPEPALVPARKE